LTVLVLYGYGSGDYITFISCLVGVSVLQGVGSRSVYINGSVGYSGDYSRAVSVIGSGCSSFNVDLAFEEGYGFRST
jgi:hypothetical protein